MGTKRERVLVGVFESSDYARQAIKDLRDAGFSDRNIGLLTRNAEGEPGVTAFRDLEGNRAAKGAAVGVAAGAGGGALWALGIAAGFLPAIGPVIGGGLLMAIAASAAAGAGAGALVGTLVGMGVTDEEAAYYDEEFKKGRTIVVVEPGGRTNLVATIFRGNGAAAPRAVTSRTLAEQVIDEQQRR